MYVYDMHHTEVIFFLMPVMCVFSRNTKSILTRFAQLETEVNGPLYLFGNRFPEEAARISTSRLDSIPPSNLLYQFPNCRFPDLCLYPSITAIGNLSNSPEWRIRDLSAFIKKKQEMQRKFKTWRRHKILSWYHRKNIVVETIANAFWRSDVLPILRKCHLIWGCGCRTKVRRRLPGRNKPIFKSTCLENEPFRLQLILRTSQRSCGTTYERRSQKASHFK